MPADTSPSGLGLDNIVHLITLGGPIVAVLLAMSVFGLAIVLLKLWQFGSIRVGRRRFIEPALANWRAGRFDAAQQRVNNEHHPIADTLGVAMRGMATGIDCDTVREEAARVGARHLATLRGYFRPLEVIGSLAPLLGLLGTVLGMIDVFSQLASAGGAADPAMLSGGIWEALLTTAIGLIVAVPAVLMLNWFERILERLHEDMQDALTQVFTQCHTQLAHAASDKGATAATTTNNVQTGTAATARYAH